MVPPNLEAGGKAVLAVAVDETGAVTSVVPLLATAPFGKLLEDAVGAWKFAPSGSPADAMAGVTLVIAVFHSPSAYEQGPSPVPAPPGGGLTEIPLPTTVVTPHFPPKVYSGGVAVLKLHVDGDGHVAESRPVGDVTPFTEVARTAAAKWQFRPAERNGKRVDGVVYGVFAFPARPGMGPTP